ncbi:hypothetical protein J1N35_000979 [Gossypium stocksii]|uniref:Uncharacterized protein n=1 Tax=Gossypium stocksii TaxID=47602 RepID=A0A9D4AKY2_9ROSI|nr:hypothetical protein J1N35_000979 [Gossypium stocksii]
MNNKSIQRWKNAGGNDITQSVDWRTTTKRQSGRGGQGRDDDGPRRVGSNLLTLEIDLRPSITTFY